MAWNEPGNDNKDPWGNRNQNNRGGNDGPPDLDEVLKNLFGGLFGGSGGGGGRGRNNGPSARIVIGVVFTVLLVAYGIKGIGIVNEQEQAVVLRLGKYHQTRGPGIRWNPPLIDQVETVNVTAVRTLSTNQSMLTKDLNIVDIKLSVQYVISSAQDFVLNVRDPEASLDQAASSALRHVVGSEDMHSVLTEGRSAIAVDVQVRLQDYMSSYTSGIQVDKVNVEDTNPPKQVQSAFDDVIKAREDEERFKNEAQAYANDKIPKARGFAQRVVAESLAYKEQVIANAEGEAQRFTMLLNEYQKAPEVTRQRLYLETMQLVLSNTSKVMVDVDGGNNMMYLPLDKIVSAPSNSQQPIMSLSSREKDDIVRDLKNELRKELKSLGSGRRGSR